MTFDDDDIANTFGQADIESMTDPNLLSIEQRLANGNSVRGYFHKDAPQDAKSSLMGAMNSAPQSSPQPVATPDPNQGLKDAVMQ